MSFFTSFCDFPQKEQHSVWFSRLSTNCSAFQAPPGRRPGRRPPAMVRLSALNLTLLQPAGRFLDDHFVDQTVFRSEERRVGREGGCGVVRYVAGEMGEGAG